MNKIKQLLQEADPLRGEPAVSPIEQDRRRQGILAAARAASSPTEATKKTQLRVVRLATVAVVVAGILFLGSLLLPRSSFHTYAAVRFEIRLAEESPGPGLREVKVDGRTIYLHPEVVVSNGDIESVELLPGNSPSEFHVGVKFNAEGARRMRAATGDNIGKRMAILIDDEVVMAPVVRSAIESAAEINGNYTKDQAERIVKGLEAN